MGRARPYEEDYVSMKQTVLDELLPEDGLKSAADIFIRAWEQEAEMAKQCVKYNDMYDPQYAGATTGQILMGQVGSQKYEPDDFNEKAVDLDAEVRISMMNISDMLAQEVGVNLREGDVELETSFSDEEMVFRIKPKTKRGKFLVESVKEEVVGSELKKG